MKIILFSENQHLIILKFSYIYIYILLFKFFFMTLGGIYGIMECFIAVGWGMEE